MGQKNFHQNYAHYFSHQNGVQHVDRDLQLQGQIRGQPVKNGFLVNNFFVIDGGGKFFLINTCSDRTLLMVYNMLTLTFIFKVK